MFPLLATDIVVDEDEDEAVFAAEPDVAPPFRFMCVAGAGLSSMLDWVNVVICEAEDEADVECCRVPEELAADDEEEEEDDA